MPNPLDMVTQDQSDNVPRPRVYIYGDDDRPAGTEDVPYQNKLTQAVAPAPPTDIMALIAKVKDRLLGTGGEERYQTWPERMVREGFTAPGDVLSRTELSTSESLIEPAQAVAGLASGSTLFAKPGVGTLGSGPMIPGAKAVPVEPAPVFYSALEHATTNAAQETMSPGQWLGYLKNQPGVKAEELQWTGLPEWLAGQKGKVKKQDVQQYLDEHKVEIKDVTKGGPQATDLITDDVHDLGVQAVLDTFLAENPKWVGKEHTAAFERAHERFAESERGEEIYNNAQQKVLEPEGAVKYSSYQLPGGENYREHLLTMPVKNKNADARARQIVTRMDEISDQYSKVKDPVELDRLSNEYADLTAEKSELRAGPAQQYNSSHWDEPNVLAHVRTNDRDVGGQKSLHIEEIQSDWHQQGRKQGYRPPNPEVTPELKDISARVDPSDRAARSTDPAYWAGAPGWVADAVKAGRITQAEADRLKAYNDAWTMKGVPDAPFKTTWPELALKRMIRHAAENGYDRISWTPGEAQAARYDLSKTVSKVHYMPDLQGGTLAAEGLRPGQTVLDKSGVKPEQIADYIGKDAADKLLKATKDKDGIHTLEGVDLKVGGEGMREFYDKMLPKMAEKIGKAHGVKVKQGDLSSATLHEASEASGGGWHVRDAAGDDVGFYQSKAAAEAAVRSNSRPVYYFDLPQSLKDHAVGRGFPLYMSGIPFPLTPVDHDPFKKEKDYDYANQGRRREKGRQAVRSEGKV